MSKLYQLIKHPTEGHWMTVGYESHPKGMSHTVLIPTANPDARNVVPTASLKGDYFPSAREAIEHKMNNNSRAIRARLIMIERLRREISELSILLRKTDEMEKPT